MNIIVLWLVRVVFGSLTCFELGNLAGFFHFEIDFSWLGLSLTALVVWMGLEFVLFFVKKRFNYTIPAFIFLIPLANILIDFFGDFCKLYSRIVWYDQMAHFIGGASAAGVIFFIVCAVLKRRRVDFKKYLIASYAFFAACFLGNLYELEEYAESLFLGNNRLGDRFDTPNDIFFNACGALIGVLLVYFYVRLTDTMSKTEEK